MVVKMIENAAEFDEAIKSPGLTVVDWYADWCGPCKMIAPMLADMSEEADLVAAGVHFIKVNVDTLQSLAQKNEISAMPTFHYYKAGQRVEVLVGADRSKLRALVLKHK